MITAPGAARDSNVDRQLGTTSENPVDLDFPEETSIGAQPDFQTQQPPPPVHFEEHTIVTDESAADASSEAIIVVDSELEEEPETLQENPVPPRSVPPPFPRT